MIVGLDHIAFASGDVERDASQLEAIGYQLKFTEPHLANQPGKRIFLEQWVDQVHMAYMQFRDSVPIELNYHSAVAKEKRCSYLPFYKSAPPTTVCSREPHVLTDRLSHILGQDVAVYFWPALNCEIVAGLGDNDLSISALIIPCYDLDLVCDFFSALLGNPRQTGDIGRTFQISSVFTRSRLDIVLVSSPLVPARHYLDWWGPTCFGLLTTNSGQDLKKLSRVYPHIEACAPFQHFVGGKQLTLSYAFGPEAILIELIDPTR